MAIRVRLLWPVESKQNVQLSESTELCVSNRTKQLLSSSEAGNPLLSASAKRNDLEKSREISPSWSHGQAWFVIYDIPRRVWRPIRARTHLATPQMKEWLRRSSNSTRKGRSHHHNTDKRPFVERNSRWMSAQIFWLADWLVRDMWPECCLQTSVSESAMLIHVWERRDFTRVQHKFEGYCFMAWKTCSDEMSSMLSTPFCIRASKYLNIFVFWMWESRIFKKKCFLPLKEVQYCVYMQLQYMYAPHKQTSRPWAWFPNYCHCYAQWRADCATHYDYMNQKIWMFFAVNILKHRSLCTKFLKFMEQVLIALQWYCKFCAFSCLLQGAILKEAQFFNGASVACAGGSGLSKNNAVHCRSILCISWIWILTIVSTFLAKNVFNQVTICTKWWYCRSRKSVKWNSTYFMRTS